MARPLRYDPAPTYPPVVAGVESGWDALRAALPAAGRVLAIDGPALLGWDALLAGLAAGPLPVRTVDVSRYFVPWDEVIKRTAAGDALAGDPNFATLPTGTLADLFDELPSGAGDPSVLTVVHGPGAALVRHDVLWYADLPKRFAEAETVLGRGRDLGRGGPGGGSTRRLFYIDWPLLDRHRQDIAPRVDRWIDTQDVDAPTSLDGPALRATVAALSGQPFRTRPTFNTTSWGGHWAQRELGMNVDATNTALGYELIAPESGVLVGERGGPCVEVPFQLLVELRPDDVLGPEVHGLFGTSFPIRFDYLDTVDGGNLSIHCHPRPDYMRDVFGWPYTQHETYYVMVGSTDNAIYLGLQGGVDVAEFEHRAHAADEAGTPFQIEEFIQSHPAEAHQLFLIPAGTPHGSGEGNVVLEISATPYLYSLRFYDWLRRGPTGEQRAVHVDHAFRNLGLERTGDAVRDDLIQRPRTVAGGTGWHEEVIGALPEMFFEVRRIRLEPDAAVDLRTDGHFQILNVVEGEGLLVRTSAGSHALAYAETLVVPAATGGYRLEAVGDAPVRVVRAHVR